MSIKNNKSRTSDLCSKKGKRNVVFAPFFNGKTLADRPFMVSTVLSRLKPVDIVTTDFDHQTKEFKNQCQIGSDRMIYYLKTPKYSSNISVARFLSHFIFSLRAAFFFFKRRNDYDIVYVTLPLNLAALLVFYLCRHHTKIADVIDIWPDVLPFTGKMKLILAPAFSVWKKCFQLSINKADILITVSDYFLQQSLKYFKKNQTFSARFYIGHRLLPVSAEARGNDLKIAYIGNIGHLYDFNTLVEALSLQEIRSKYQLHIIGDGDRKKWLLDELEKRSLKFVYYGIVYDELRIAKILGTCHVGFNGYINTTATFSYKAGTYFAARLPIINSMTGDLQTAVDEHGIGVNYTAGSVQSLSRCLSVLNQDTLSKMSESTYQFFMKEIDQEKIMDNIESFVRSIEMSSKTIC